jgi:hypothetical protein
MFATGTSSFSSMRLKMLDLFFLAIGTLFLVACWYFVKACERL